MPRQSRKKSSTGIYHVMLRGINKQDIFEKEERLAGRLTFPFLRPEGSKRHPSGCRARAVELNLL